MPRGAHLLQRLLYAPAPELYSAGASCQLVTIAHQQSKIMIVFEGASAQGAVSWAAPGVRPGSHLRPSVASINHSTIKKSLSPLDSKLDSSLSSLSLVIRASLTSLLTLPFKLVPPSTRFECLVMNVSLSLSIVAFAALPIVIAATATPYNPTPYTLSA